MNDVAARRSFSIILIGRLASLTGTVVRSGPAWDVRTSREIVMYDVVGEHRRIESNLISDSASSSLPRRRQGIRRRQRRPPNCPPPARLMQHVAIAFAYILDFALNTVTRRERASRQHWKPRAKYQVNIISVWLLLVLSSPVINVLPSAIRLST